MNCLFCNQPEEIPGAEVEFICSSCTQLLLDTEPKERVRAYRKAVELGYDRKASAIRIFLNPEDLEDKTDNGRDSKQHRADFNRGRAFKVVGNFKGRVGRSAV